MGGLTASSAASSAKRRSFAKVISSAGINFRGCGDTGGGCGVTRSPGSGGVWPRTTTVPAASSGPRSMSSQGGGALSGCKGADCCWAGAGSVCGKGGVPAGRSGSASCVKGITSRCALRSDDGSTSNIASGPSLSVICTLGKADHRPSLASGTGSPSTIVTASGSPWRTVARRDPLQSHQNLLAGAGSTLNPTETLPKDRGVAHLSVSESKN
jgi:hypothetical protein